MERRKLEELWRGRLADARLRLDFATSYVNEVQQDFALDEPSPDGQLAYERAVRAQNAALAEYNRVLRTFSDLVIDGKIPDEDA